VRQVVCFCSWLVCRAGLRSIIRVIASAWGIGGCLLESLKDDFQSELVQARERGQVRAGEGSVRHVAPIAIRGMSRCRHGYRVDWFRASAPEFGELPGKGSALVITGSSGGRPRRLIHQIAAECVAGVAIRQDGFDSAAAGA
jgi:hypothetical protein